MGISIRNSTVLLAAGMLWLSACGDDEEREFGPPRPGDGDTTLGLASRELAGVLAAADTAEIRQATLARQRARDGLVRAYAERIIDDHQHSARIQMAGLQRLDVTPIESDESRQLQERSAEVLASLQNQTVNFDRLFLEAQITAHQQVLRLLDESQACIGPSNTGTGGAASFPLGRGCIGLGAIDFAGRDTDSTGEAGGGPGFNLGGGMGAVGQVDDDQALFIVLRSTLIAHLMEAIWLRDTILSGTPAAAR